jgi:hypothetical protein
MGASSPYKHNEIREGKKYLCLTIAKNWKVIHSQQIVALKLLSN